MKLNLKEIFLIVALGLSTSAPFALGDGATIAGRGGFTGPVGESNGTGGGGSINYAPGPGGTQANGPLEGSYANRDLYAAFNQAGSVFYVMPYRASNALESGGPLLSTDYNSSPWTVTEVQAALSKRGYYYGPTSGLVGPYTTQAISEYERDARLPITGTVTEALLQSLNLN
jgi:hypothetical protein